MPKRRGHGEGSIYQRKDGRWCASVDLGWIGGKRKRKVVYGDTRKEVVEKLKALQSVQQQGLPVSVERQTVAQYLTRWVEDVARHRVRETTYVNYRHMIDFHIVPNIGRILVTRLTPQDVQLLLGTLLRNGSSPKTAKNVRSLLNVALGQAVAWGLIPRNVVAGTTTPRVPRYTPVVLSVEQSKAFLASIRGDRLEALYVTALLLGLRRGEVLGLRWSDIDWQSSTLRIERSLSVAGNKAILAPPKTEASVRVLPMPDVVARLLSFHHEAQAIQRAIACSRWVEQGFVFTVETGGPIRPRNVLTYFHKALARAGLPRMRFHDLRHSCASLLAAAGVPPRTAMEILGHTNIGVTLGIYTHVLDSAKRSAAAVMDDLFKPED